MTSFTEGERSLTKIYNINDEFKKAECDGLDLLPHQLTSIAAMIEIEDKRTVTGSHCMYNGNLRCTTSSGVLSDKFGSGKTFTILGLILNRKSPDNRPIYQACKLKTNNKTSRAGFLIEKKFKQNHILNANLIFVASSVFMQWKQAINSHTDLKVLYIQDVRELRKLYDLIQNNSISMYDIVLVKNGNISGKFDIKEYVEEKNDKKVRSIYNIIANITRSNVWSRVIIDDYDIIRLPRPTSMINGLFTWFVSTTRFSINKRDSGAIEHKYIENILKYNNIEMGSLVYSLNNNAFNVHNDDSYVEMSVAIGKPLFWVHTVVNKNKKYIDLIGEMSGGKATEIMRMLQGDAINTAAELAGINTDNITNIFEKVLHDKYDLFAKSTSTLRFINTLNIEEFKYLPQPDEGDKYHKKDVYEHKPITKKYPDIKKKVLEVKDECEINEKESSKAIERVKDNIKEGDCPICCCELVDTSTVILRCCGVIICADCSVQGTYLKRIYNAIQGKCPKCRAIVGFPDFIFMDNNFDLNKIIEDKPAIEPRNYNTLNIPNDLTKNEVLIRIIKGEETAKTQKDINIDGMLKGVKELPIADADKRKVIIFSRYDEALDGTEKELHKAEINFKRIKGTVTQIHSTVSEFHDSYDGINVLLINGEKYASGLNLQSATDLVFMHRIHDTNIESQIIGRIQRLGRKFEANIHYILYKEEVF